MREAEDAGHKKGDGRTGDAPQKYLYLFQAYSLGFLFETDAAKAGKLLADWSHGFAVEGSIIEPRRLGKTQSYHLFLLDNLSYDTFVITESVQMAIAPMTTQKDD